MNLGSIITIQKPFGSPPSELLHYTATEIARGYQNNEAQNVCLQGNDLVHNSQIAQLEALSSGYDILPNSLYFPDLAPNAFLLFLPVKVFLKGKWFQNDEALNSEVTS